MASNARKKDEKFSANWNGSYKIGENVGGHIDWSNCLENQYRTHGMYLISNFTLKIRLNKMIHVTLLCNPKCTLFPHSTFLPKEGFGRSF